jgi:bacteriocin-like protein
LEGVEEKMEEAIALRELTEKELDHVSGGAKPNQNAGGGPGNSGPGDKHSPVEGPPHFP